MRASCLSAAFLIALPSAGLAATTSVDNQWPNAFGTGVNPRLTSDGTTNLTAGATDGTASTAGDGAVFQIGVFVGVSTGLDPASFTPGDWGTFTPITGLGSLNPGIDTTIGDGTDPGGSFVGGFPDGLYAIGVTFDTTVHTLPAELLAGDLRLGVRYFDTTADPDTVTGEQWNTVTSFNSGWVLSSPSDTPSTPKNAKLDDRISPTTGAPVGEPLVWEDSLNPFITSIPEPSTTLLSLLGASLLFRRRRSDKA